MAGIKEKSGGGRKNSGRRRGINQKPIPLKIDLDLVKNRNGFINDAVREKLKNELKPE